MSPDDFTAIMIMYWVLFALTCSVFFLVMRVRLRQNGRRFGYPYAVYGYRRRRLRRQYFLTMGYSIVIAVSIVGLWRLDN